MYIHTCVYIHHTLYQFMGILIYTCIYVVYMIPKKSLVKDVECLNIVDTDARKKDHLSHGLATVNELVSNWWQMIEDYPLVSQHKIILEKHQFV